MFSPYFVIISITNLIWTDLHQISLISQFQVFSNSIFSLETDNDVKILQSRRLWILERRRDSKKHRDKQLKRTIFEKHGVNWEIVAYAALNQITSIIIETFELVRQSILFSSGDIVLVIESIKQVGLFYMITVHETGNISYSYKFSCVLIFAQIQFRKSLNLNIFTRI